MRNFIRSPLTWAVVAELLVVGALLVVAWNAIGSAARTAVAIPAVAAPAAGPTDEAVPLPDIPAVTGQGARGPLPGLNLDSAFWRSKLAELNRDQAALAQLEWRVVHAGMVAAKDYV